MQEVQYEAPRSIADAVRLLVDAPVETRILAGGTDLLVGLRREAPRAQRIVDLKRIPELCAIELDDRELRIGAAASCFDLSERDDVRARHPGLVESAELIGSMQIQGRASIGGNLCNASPAADTAPALIAARAECQIAGPSGTRTLPVASFVTGPGRTALGPGEILVALRVPAPPARSADAYLRFIPRGEMDIAVVGAGVALCLDDSGTCREARVALGAVAPVPIEAPEAAAALVGTRVDDEALRRAGAAAAAAARPIDDMRAPAGYRRRLADVLTRRAARIAAERAAARS